MAVNIVKERTRRLAQITKVHETTHLSIHNDFKRQLTAKLRELGLAAPRSLSEYMALPPALHAAMAQVKQETAVALDLALQAKMSSVAKLPNPRYRTSGRMRLVRMN